MQASSYRLGVADMAYILASIPTGESEVEFASATRWPGELLVVRQNSRPVAYIHQVRQNKRKFRHRLAKVLAVILLILDYDLGDFGVFEYRYNMFLHDFTGRLLLSIRRVGRTRWKRSNYTVHLPDGTQVAEIRRKRMSIRGVGPLAGTSVQFDRTWEGSEFLSEVFLRWAQSDGRPAFQNSIRPPDGPAYRITGEPVQKIFAAAALLRIHVPVEEI
jgi:hypothetical protein